MNKFKQGDKVVFIINNSNFKNLEYGKTYTIKNVEYGSVILEDNLPSSNNSRLYTLTYSYSQDYFELLSLVRKEKILKLMK